ncbi:MAG: wax ester/triacylglycerol synthase family O-acyltransferase, partial [Candidatus Methylomirabilis sp.]|nr:wax ester/triacylglycerol synthase family O-acyltransferase [Deltaproteobacteria bacterium]
TYHMTVAALAILDPSTAPEPFTFLRFRRHVEERLHRAPTFRRRLVRVPLDLDHPYWAEDPEFDLDAHLHHLAVPPPGGRAELMALFGRLISRPLDLRRALWEMHFIEGLAPGIEGAPEGSVALVYKFHHAAIDGVSGVELVSTLLDPTPEPEPVRSPDKPWTPDRIPSDLELVAKALGHTITGPLRAAELLPKLLSTVGRMGKELGREALDRVGHLDLPKAPATAPKTSFNGTVCGRRVYDAAMISLAEVKAVKARVPGATVNDVALCVCAGALRRYLEDRGELPEDPLVAILPVSVRSADERGAMGNRVSILRCAIYTEVKDPRERLLRIVENTHHAKRLHGAMDTGMEMEATRFLASGLLGVFTRAVSALHVADRAAPLANVTISNVPGPRFPLYAAGARVLAEFGSGPVVDGIGLLIGVFSYDGRVSLGFTACKRLLP